MRTVNESTRKDLLRMHYGNGNGNHIQSEPLPEPRALYGTDYGRDRSFTNHSDRERERVASATSRSHAIMIGSGSYEARAGGDALKIGSAPGDTRYDRLGGRAQEGEFQRERGLRRERRESERGREYTGNLSGSPMTPVVGERFAR